jgi:hypothetical protein
MAEMLGFMASLLLAFDVLLIDGDCAAHKVPEMDKCSLAAAVCKPKQDGSGFGMRLRR